MPFFLSFSTFASVVGVSTYPLAEKARVISAEMMGFMNQRHEMGAGLRYTQEVASNKLLYVSVSGGQESRGFTMGAGLDIELLSEDTNRPRISFKPFLLQEKFDDESATIIGAAPSLRLGLSYQGTEFFPYIALPNGFKIDNSNEELVYYSAFTLGASMPFPGARNERVLLTVEGNKNLGAASDSIGCLVSWMWN